MNDKATAKRLLAVWVTFCMILSSFSVLTAVNVAPVSADTTEQAELIFSGFDMQYSSDGKTIQALVDISVNKVYAKGAGFTLKYDPNIIVPSSASDNADLTDDSLSEDPWDFYNGSSSYKQNLAVIPDKYARIDLAYINTDKNFFTFNVSVDESLTETAAAGYDKIVFKSSLDGGDTVQVPTIDSTGGAVSLGQLSFRIVNSQTLFNMTEDQLQSILTVVDTTYDTDVLSDAFVRYVASDKDEYDKTELAEIKWEIQNNTPTSTQARVNESTVSAYSLYQRLQTGTVDDLFKYLNQTMSHVIMSYSDGHKETNRIAWNKDPKVSIVTTDRAGNDDYDPKGDITYTIVQYFGYGTGEGHDIRELVKDAEQMDLLKGYRVEVTVHVTPSTVVDLTYDRRILSFLDDPGHRPQDWDALLMPDAIIPVMSGVDDLYVVPTESPQQADWNPDDITDDLKNGPAVKTQTFDHWFNPEVFKKGEADYPAWLTLPTPTPSIPDTSGSNTTDMFWYTDAIRNILPADARIPDENDKIEAEVKPDGKLVITVHTLGGAAVPAGTEFKVYIPNGQIAETGTNTNYAKTEISGGIATITIDALYTDSETTSPTLDERKATQWLINAGSSDFRISALQTYGTEVVESSQLPFTFDPRRNDYLPEDKLYYTADIDALNNTIKYIDKDYSGTDSNLFPIYAGQEVSAISTYITFPKVNDTIPVTFSRQTGALNGTQPGRLTAAKVESWELRDMSNNALSDQDVIGAAGTDIYLVGKLADPYSYSSAGTVENNYNVYLRLKVTPMAVLAPEPTATPTATPEVQETPDPSAEPTAEPTPEPTAPPKYGVEIYTKVPYGSSDATEVLLNEKTFEYDTKQVGYDNNVQDQKYLIKNIGTENLSEFSVRIADTKYCTQDASGDYTIEQPCPISFLIGDDKVYTLDTDDTTVLLSDVTEVDSCGNVYVNIRTAGQLAEGLYTAKVYVGASNNDSLSWFNISFRVTKDTPYRVTINNEHPERGMGYLMKDGGATIASNTYIEGDDVGLLMIMQDDAYEFERWEAVRDDDGSLLDSTSFPDPTSETTSFKMVPSDVTVTPQFLPSTAVYLRPTMIQDFNSSDDTENNLRSTTPPDYNVVSYDEKLHNYRVIVEGKYDENYVTIDLKNHLLPDMQMKMTYTDSSGTEHDLDYNPETVPPASTGTSGTTKYKSDSFPLEEGEITTVTITMTYTDGDGKNYEQVYTLEIYRKTAVKVTFNPGNSPAGIIMGSENLGTVEQREAILKDFRDNPEHMLDPDNPPERAVNTLHTRYSLEAWKYREDGKLKYNASENYDNDPDALFVYLNTAFVDPGIKELYSLSSPRETIAPDKIKEIKRTIKSVYVYDDASLNVGDMINPSPKPTDIPVVASGDENGRCLITELQGKTIRPGVYQIEYEFEDLDSSRPVFTRPIIILPQKGDVNVSGAADTSDADILYQRMNNTYFTPAPTTTPEPTAMPEPTATPEAGGGTPADPTPTPIVLTPEITDVNNDGKDNDSFYRDILLGSSQWTQLFAYRVADVTEDINANSIDANAIITKPAILTRQYYEPLPASMDDNMPTVDYSVNPASPHPTGEPVPTATPKPVLVLDYLGNADTSPAETSQNNNNYLSERSVFTGFDNPGGLIWVGIGIRNVPNLEYFLSGLYSIDLAIDYDPSILVPCDTRKRIPGDTGYTVSNLASNLTNINVDSSTTNDAAYWKNAQIDASALRTHLDLDPTDNYMTEFISIRSTDTSTLRLNGVTAADMDKTYYLVRVPFRLVSWPTGYAGLPITINLTESLNEPTLSGQTFVLGSGTDGVTHSAAWESSTKAADGTIEKKTTDVNNAYNHFDVDINDIFKTNATFNVTGTLRGWNPAIPFVVKFFDANNPDKTEPEASFHSRDKAKYGLFTTTLEGEVEWHFNLPVSTQFVYKMVITKTSHIDHVYEQPISITNATDGEQNISEPIEMTVGDINHDGYIKDPDRARLIRFFDRKKPWGGEYADDFAAADLNGDEKVNIFDLNLLKRSMRETEKGGGTE